MCEMDDEYIFPYWRADEDIQGDNMSGDIYKRDKVNCPVCSIPVEFVVTGFPKGQMINANCWNGHLLKIYNCTWGFEVQENIITDPLKVPLSSFFPW